MLLSWLDARRAAELGATLADQFASATEMVRPVSSNRSSDPIKGLLEQAQREVRSMDLNFFKKAKLANSFKWRLLERGVKSETVHEITQSLVMHLSMSALSHSPGTNGTDQARLDPRQTKEIFQKATQHLLAGNHLEAVRDYEIYLRQQPTDANALSNLGAALFSLARYAEAERYLRKAIKLNPKLLDAHSNLGAVLQARAQLGPSETALRRALKLNPKHVNSLVCLGFTYLASGRVKDARTLFDRAVSVAPDQGVASLGLANCALMEGRFGDAEAAFNSTLKKNPDSADAWAGLVSCRKMTKADSNWLTRTEKLLKTGLNIKQEINLRYAIGKYCDDVGDYKRAFQQYKLANELCRTIQERYQRDAHSRYVDDITRVYSAAVIAKEASNGSPSERPVLVVGMPRSGTSLVEQIIASHSAAAGAGELQFWTDAVHQHESGLRQRPLDASTKRKLAARYLSLLTKYSADADRVVDKAPVNADYIGIFHTAFPKARIIYMQRNPLDTCLSCYFQNFSSALSFSLDLDDLAHYYREHSRLVKHWHSVLPAGTILDVPYDELVADPERWSRKIVDFLGLAWEDQCLSFHTTTRAVATASAWQVRQRIYTDSVERWRRYSDFIGPLREFETIAR